MSYLRRSTPSGRSTVLSGAPYVILDRVTEAALNQRVISLMGDHSFAEYSMAARTR